MNLKIVPTWWIMGVPVVGGLYRFGRSEEGLFQIHRSLNRYAGGVKADRGDRRSRGEGGACVRMSRALIDHRMNSAAKR